MLHLVTGLKVILTRWNFGRLPNAMTPAKGRQGLIGDLGATCGQFFMDPDEIAFA